MRPVPPELVEALTDLLDQPVEPHKDVRVRELRKRLRRAYLPWSAQQVNRVPASLVAPHFEAWLALVKAGGRVEVVEGNQVVAVLQAPVSVQARRRSKSGPLGASALRPHP